MSMLTILHCSRGMAGTMTPEFLEGKVDINGTTFQEAAAAVGYGAKSHKVGMHSALPAAVSTMLAMQLS